VIKPEAAIRQRNEQAAAQGSGSGTSLVESGGLATQAGGGLFAESGVTDTAIGGVPAPVKARRFHGVVSIDATRLSRDTGTIAEAVVQHLAGLMDSEVEVTLEIRADIPEGAPDDVVRTVTENCRTLKFDTFGFEES
jgi:hypothetical protein